MKKHILTILLVLNFAFLFAASNVFAVEHKSVAAEDKIVAVVNDDVVTESELNNQINALKQQFEHSATAMPPEKEIREKVLDGLINKALQLQLAKKNNVTISDAEVDNAINDIAKRNNLTIAKMQTEIEHQGMTYAFFRSHIKEEMLLNKAQQLAFGHDITVSDQEVDAFLKSPQDVQTMPTMGVSNASRYHVMDVLIPIEDNSAAKIQNGKEKAASVMEKLRNKSASFDQALKNITAADSSIKTDDLGFRPIGAFPNIFIEEVIKMKVGDVVGPIQAPNGFHILKLIAERGVAAPKTHRLTRDEAHAFLYKQKFDEKTKSWVQELRATAYVKINE